MAFRRWVFLLAGLAAATFAGCGAHGQSDWLLRSPSSAQPLGVSPDLVSGNIISTFIAPSPAPGHSMPGLEAIAFGPDHNLWALDVQDGDVDRVTPTGAYTEFGSGAGFTGTEQITKGPSGDLWYSWGSHIGRITTGGTITLFPLPSGACAHTGVAEGADGNLWFDDSCTKKIGRMTPAGVVMEFALPAEAGVPWGIAKGPDGNLWFTSTIVSGASTSYYGKITTTGMVTTFTPAFSADLRSIVAGPDGNLYAGDVSGGLARIATSGTAMRFATKFGSGGPYGLAVGPDRQIWMTTSFAQIGEFNTATHAMSPVVTMPNVGSATPGGASGIASGPFGDMWFTSGAAHPLAQYVGRYEEGLATVGIRLNGEMSIVDPNYGFELGYAVGAGTLTQTVMLAAGESVVFKNLDSFFPHTAAFLPGTTTSTSAPWPASFTGGTSTSPAGTAIGTTGWSTGTLTPGATSPIYSTGMPGFYMVGCQFHYVADHMRTVFVVR